MFLYFGVFFQKCFHLVCGNGPHHDTVHRTLPQHSFPLKIIEKLKESSGDETPPAVTKIGGDENFPSYVCLLLEALMKYKLFHQTFPERNSRLSVISHFYFLYTSYPCLKHLQLSDIIDFCSFSSFRKLEVQNWTALLSFWFLSCNFISRFLISFFSTRWHFVSKCNLIP